MRTRSTQSRSWWHHRFIPSMRTTVLARFANLAYKDSHGPSPNPTLRFQKRIRRIAVIGGGPIAVSWAAWYFMRGFDVVAADPAQTEAGNSHLDLMSVLLDPTQPLSLRGTFKVVSDLDKALPRADFIQECAPATASSKVNLLAEIDKCTRPDSVIASDVNASTMCAAQNILRFGDRCIIVRPLDLPHLNPFTVILNSTGTSPLAIRHVMKFYSRVGKVPIYLRAQTSDDFTSGLLALFREETARLRELDIVSETDVHADRSWAPSLCCSALVSAIQGQIREAILHRSAGSSLAAGSRQPGSNHFVVGDRSISRTVVSTDPACVS